MPDKWVLLPHTLTGLAVLALQAPPYSKIRGDEIFMFVSSLRGGTDAFCTKGPCNFCSGEGSDDCKCDWRSPAVWAALGAGLVSKWDMEVHQWLGTMVYSKWELLQHFSFSRTGFLWKSNGAWSLLSPGAGLAKQKALLYRYHLHTYRSDIYNYFKVTKSSYNWGIWIISLIYLEMLTGL